MIIHSKFDSSRILQLQNNRSSYNFRVLFFLKYPIFYEYYKSRYSIYYEIS